MNISIFLAQAFGIYLIVAGLFIFLRRDLYRRVLSDLTKNPSVVLISGVYTLILGILIVLSHNEWVANWPVIITLLGYITLIKGAAYLFFPEAGIQSARAFLTNTAMFINGTISLALGIYLCIMGFIDVVS